MVDPFVDLRPVDVPVAPDPVFAARLRSRLERALFSLNPEGDTVSTATTAEENLAHPPGVVPYLIVADARRALQWYEETLGARRRGSPIVMDDGRIGHAELALAGAVIYVADDPSPSTTDVAAPSPGAPAAVSLVLETDDVDRVVDSAINAGAVLERDAADYPHGRNAVIRDPFGHRWMVSGPVLTAVSPRRPVVSERTEAIRQGDVGYLSLWVADAEVSARFFATVLGWQYEPANEHGGRSLAGAVPSQGLVGGHERPTGYVAFAVDDVDAAIERVRSAGGSAEAPDEQPYGRIAMCSDDQGASFSLYTPVVGDVRPATHGHLHGELTYISFEVVDGPRARAFYEAVLGWETVPGATPGGFGPQATAPMIGMHGPHDRATVVPSYVVDDITVAVARIRAIDGTATDPDPRPYGLTSACADSGGTRFYLHQL